jgi:hypothetical protein
MKNRVNGTTSLLRIAVIGIALALSSAQGGAADSLRPTMDAGGSGGGSHASNGAISAEVSPVQEHREAALAAESMQASAGTYYVTIDEQGNAIVPELVAAGVFAQAGSPSQQQRVMTCPPCATTA